MTTPREPEANQKVYALGHYEQMLLAKAVEAAVWPDRRETALTDEERVNLARLRPLFAAYGTVTVLRHEAEQ